MSKTELKDLAGISFNIIAKLGKCEAVSMESMYKICTALDCNIGDIMEFLKPGVV
ncbi:helix-turn-helix transcriptional regulator [Faecalibacterium sp. I4-3-84]|nr:helix-turn-helix transcriptional regulator [Faecalibacterium sp. I4-3-84]UQK38747.1 helix-turn-helix transcriptional regulator [Faecalibacterium sp. I4-3-84]